MQATHSATVPLNTLKWGLISEPLHHDDPDFPSTKAIVCKILTAVVWHVKCWVGLRWDLQTPGHFRSKPQVLFLNKAQVFICFFSLPTPRPVYFAVAHSPSTTQTPVCLYPAIRQFLLSASTCGSIYTASAQLPSALPFPSDSPNTFCPLAALSHPRAPSPSLLRHRCAFTHSALLIPLQCVSLAVSCMLQVSYLTVCFWLGKPRRTWELNSALGCGPAQPVRLHKLHACPWQHQPW